MGKNLFFAVLRGKATRVFLTSNLDLFVNMCDDAVKLTL
jgi:hypothetical protein